MISQKLSEARVYEIKKEADISHDKGCYRSLFPNFGIFKLTKREKPKNELFSLICNRGDRIRTCDPLVPNQVL